LKLSGVRLRNYTSFEDSRWLDISDELTILIGKNGAGKSSLLRAIALLAGQQWPVPSDAQPVWGDVTPRLMMRFSVTEDERLSILRAAKIDDDANLRAFASGIEIDVSKSTYGVTSINRKFKSRRLEKLDAPAREATLAKVLEAHAAFTAIAGGRYKARIDAKSTWVDVHTASNQAIALISQQTSADFDKAAKALESAYKKHYEVHSFLRLRDEIAKRIPSRILMERASLPPTFEVEAVKAKQHRIFAHVCEIFDVEPEALLKLPVAARRNRAAQISRDLTEIVRALWSQDAIEIHFDCVGNMLTLAVTIDGRYYNYDQLSSGTAWFVSFLLQVAALEVGDDRDAVILIDEPGQYIHPVAQQRIYERLSELSKSMQVIYSTHSPYLFSRARLDQIRPIVKTQRSVVENSIFCTSDAETLTPILDVLGFPALGAFGVARERNVICEGPSDYFYLSAMHRIM
jgi:predicted ATP-dependent endonuclease of OLD family